MISSVSNPSFCTAIHDGALVPPEFEWIDLLFQKELHLHLYHIDRISQGWTNQNFKVVTEKGTYFFRVGTDHPEALGISREKEAFFYELIGRSGVTPQPLYIDPHRGILITPFIEGAMSYGKVMGTWTGNREEVIDTIVQLMKVIHAQKPKEDVPIEYAFSIIEKYFSECQKAGVYLPPDVGRALEIATELRKMPLRKDPPVLCHHDFFWENLLFDGSKLWIVDWEYADWDDPFYDLAGFCIAHRLLDEDERAILLKAYFSTFGKEEQKKLVVMCMLYSLKNALWAYLQIALCKDIPFNIRPIADMHYATFWKLFAEIGSILQIKGTNYAP